MAADAAVGVPEITPVVVFNDKPLGRAGDTENVFVLISVSVYAVVAVMAVPTVALTVCVAGEIVAVVAAIRMKIVAVTRIASSVQVTVNSVRFRVTVGVPETTPVVELIVSPAGSAGEMVKVFAPDNPVST